REIDLPEDVRRTEPGDDERCPDPEQSFFHELGGPRMGRAEAYALGRAGRPLEGVGEARAGGQDGAGPVGATVDPYPFDAGNGLCLLDPDRLSGAVEEPDARAAGAPPRPQPPRGDRLAERGRERQSVEIDAECGLAELRVVAAAEPRGQLEHTWSVRADQKLRDRRPLPDPERRGGQGCQRRRGLAAFALPGRRQREPLAHGQRLEDALPRE